MIDKFKPKSEFSRNVLTLMTGTFLAQLIPLAISPVLTRIYTPNDFGLFALVLGFATIFASVFNGRYDAAILVPKDEVDAHALFQTALYLPLIMAVIVFMLLLFIPKSILPSFGMTEEMTHLLFFIPLLAILFTYYMSFDVFLNRHKSYKKMSFLLILRVILVAFFQIVFGYFCSDGMVYGLAVGMSIGVILGWFSIIKYKYKKNAGIEQMMYLAKRYKNYPLFHMPHTFFNALSNNLPMVFIPFFFTLASSGFYLMALKVFYTPFSMLGASIEKVFRKKVVDSLHANMPIANLIKSMLLKVITITLIPYMLLVWLAPSMFTFILGESWHEVGIYVQILSPWIYGAFVVSVFVGVPIILEEQKKSLMIELIYFIFRIGGLLIGAVFYHDIYIALTLFSLGGLIVIGYNIFWIYHLTKTVNMEFKS